MIRPKRSFFSSLTISCSIVIILYNTVSVATKHTTGFDSFLYIMIAVLWGIIGLKEIERV